MSAVDNKENLTGKRDYYRYYQSNEILKTCSKKLLRTELIVEIAFLHHERLFFIAKYWYELRIFLSIEVDELYILKRDILIMSNKFEHYSIWFIV